MTSSNNEFEFVHNLESRLKERSDQLEEVHMEAAIDAQLTEVIAGGNPVVRAAEPNKEKEEAIFDDYTNPNSVNNCLSPYVPSQAERIDAFCHWVKLDSSDVLLDIGCGDGRVCVAASKLTGCTSIGLDVSPPCISMAKQVAQEEELENVCQFYEADATIDPDLLLSDSSPIASILKRVTVVYLYTYPTLLIKLVPLLEMLGNNNNVRAIVTLTYHLPNEHVVLEKENIDHEFRQYSRVTLLDAEK
mmetsp:Transcript_13221/g.21903  ORF Transcript_13221/g.21903 Transcript_13221/m.21903 type:complete len:246 (-) Transcript_13221:168-905(-)